MKSINNATIIVSVAMRTAKNTYIWKYAIYVGYNANQINRTFKYVV